MKSEGEKVKFAIVAANNHCVGFGPAKADMFRQRMELPQVVWKAKKQ